MIHSLLDKAKRFRPLHQLYNIFSPNELHHLDYQYKKLGLKKRYFEPVSTKDFYQLDQTRIPWLDKSDSRTELPKNIFFNSLPENCKEPLLDWSKNGFAVLPKFYDDQETDIINEEVEKILRKGKGSLNKYHKLMFAVLKSKKLLHTANSKRLTDILDLLMGRNVKLFQSINFIQGSEQAAHSDFVHMATYPKGYLIAAWIALEDVDSTNGPLEYFPGSHKLPYLLYPEFNPEHSKWLLNNSAYKKYEDQLDAIIAQQSFEKMEFHAKKGDVLIWHANLLHGGKAILDKTRTRKSMVLHYFCEDVICYHEITQRPALIKNIG
jgi:ectoine hydroxylase-related dioxygenase (phytanoyl-CoA dioxygenase family)